MVFRIYSPEFALGAAIRDDFVRDGANKSPPLRWDGAPENTKSFVLIVEDHDAPVGTVTHWVVYDIDAESDGLLEGLPADQVPHGINDMGHASYDGPKPPKGHGPHRYNFRLTALDVVSLGLPEEPDANTVKKAARSHVITETLLTGTFEKT